VLNLPFIMETYLRFFLFVSKQVRKKCFRKICAFQILNHLAPFQIQEFIVMTVYPSFITAGGESLNYFSFRSQAVAL
jgi:hypothetical protein